MTELSGKFTSEVLKYVSDCEPKKRATPSSAIRHLASATALTQATAQVIALSSAALSMMGPGAQAATCVTGVTPQFAQAVTGVDGDKTASVVRSVTTKSDSSFLNKDTSLKVSTEKFGISASLVPVEGQAITAVTPSFQEGLLGANSLNTSKINFVNTILTENAYAFKTTPGSATVISEIIEKPVDFVQFSDSSSGSAIPVLRTTDVTVSPAITSVSPITSDLVVAKVSGATTTNPQEKFALIPVGDVGGPAPSSVEVVTGVDTKAGNFLAVPNKVDPLYLVGNKSTFYQGVGGTQQVVSYPNEFQQFLAPTVIGSTLDFSVVTGVDSEETYTALSGVETKTGDFLTKATTVSLDTKDAVTSVGITPSTQAAIVSVDATDKVNVLTSNSLNTAQFVKDVSVGNGGASAPSTTSLACGDGAVANGLFSTALGSNASTGSFNNAIAIGANATATRNNQVVLGNKSNTYTLPGLTSAASRDAQVGKLEVVTTDTFGNLASDGGKLFDRVNDLENDVRGLNKQIERLNGGVAMAMALAGNPVLRDDQNYGLLANVGAYQGASALSAKAVVRLNRNVQLQGGAAVGLSGSGDSWGGWGGTAGVGFAW